MSVKLTIIEQMQALAREHDKTLSPLSDDVALFECGLDSLCLAVLIVRLEDVLGCDPFSGPEGMTPITFGDFVWAYENTGPERRRLAS